jgi:hypothetical protein
MHDAISMENNYTYLLEFRNGMLYHGVRSCNCDINDDNYYGSSKYTPKNEVPNKTILSTHDTREDAVSEEINYHKEHDVKCNDLYYNQSNQTSVGFDVSGVPKSDEWKQKNSKPKSVTEKYYGNNNAKGNKNKPKSEQHKQHISESHIGMIKPWLNGNTFASALKGRKKSHAHVEAVKKALSNDVVKQKWSNTWASKPNITCPHCNKQGTHNMNRYHFDNCKEKKHGT